MKRSTTLISEVVARIAFPFILLFALSLLLGGHNRPGGGFIAGVMVAAAFGLQYVVFGRGFLTRPGRGFFSFAALGLALALGTGLAGLFLGSEFSKSGILHFHLPFFGEGEVVSVFFFDLGIFFLVIGVILSILIFIGRDKR